MATATFFLSCFDLFPQEKEDSSKKSVIYSWGRFVGV